MSSMQNVWAILATTPGKMRDEIRGMTVREMKRRPAPGKWSVAEVLAHLEDVEEEGMRARVAAMVKEREPALIPFDQEKRAVELHYERRDPRRSLESFARQRRANLRWLRRLTPAQLRRRGCHQTVGVITVGEMIHEWAFHDLGHIKQILEIKRYALWPSMGHMRDFYRLT